MCTPPTLRTSGEQCSPLLHTAIIADDLRSWQEYSEKTGKIGKSAYTGALPREDGLF